MIREVSHVWYYFSGIIVIRFLVWMFCDNALTGKT